MISRSASRWDRLINPVALPILWFLAGVAYLTKDYCSAASNLAAIGERTRTLEKARRALLRALRIAGAHGCNEELARGSVSMAYIYLSNGDYQGAKRVLEPQLDTVRAVGDQRLLVEALLKLGVVRDKSGDEQTAAELWHEAAEIALRAHYTFGYAEALSNLGGIAYGAHRDSEARDFWLKAIEAARQQDDRLLVGKLSLFLGIIAVRTEDLKEARIRFDQSRANFEKGGRDDLALNARSYLDHLDGLDG